MWWPFVFWILLIPLVVVEFVLYLKTRKISWLIYALAIFTFVVAVTYTIDVFDLGRNAIILILLACSALMIVLGRTISRAPRDTGFNRTVAGALGALMLVVLVVSVLLGRLDEQIKPVAQIDADELLFDEPAKEPRIAEIVVLERVLTNNFILPVPIRQHDYRGCLVTKRGLLNVYLYTRGMEYPEVAPGQTRTVSMITNPQYYSKGEEASELLIYDFGEQQGYYSESSCESYTREPIFRIPVR
jgi:hypothetical protein